jgi:protocatechuate 3,4-dioxygenase beta subunit
MNAMSHLAKNKPTLRRTPHEEVGPMYPVQKPADRGYDLTLNPKNGKRASGQILYLSGRVLNTHGEPIAGARVELWQTNEQGGIRPTPILRRSMKISTASARR